MKTADSIEDDSVTTLLWYHQHILSFNVPMLKVQFMTWEVLHLKLRLKSYNRNKLKKSRKGLESFCYC
jgi:hypothetical protein